MAEKSTVKAPDSGTAVGDVPKTQTKVPMSTDEKAAAVAAEIARNPGFFDAILSKIQSSPVLGQMAEHNTHAMKNAAKAKAGKVLLTRIRANLLRPMLPEQYRGVLDSALVCGLVDLAVGNGLLLIGTKFQDKMPVKYQQYAQVIGECTVLSAYQDTFGTFDVEGFFTKLASGDFLDSVKEFLPGNDK